MHIVEKSNAMTGILLALVLAAAAISNVIDPFSIARFMIIHILQSPGAI